MASAWQTPRCCVIIASITTPVLTLWVLGQTPGAPPAKRPLTAVGRSGSKSISARRPLRPSWQWKYRAGILEHTGAMSGVWGLRSKVLPARKTPRATLGHLRVWVKKRPLQGPQTNYPRGSTRRPSTKL
eukprot:scaffold21870_cov60-Phaeocystis_antarctica.AAC.7